MDGQKMKKDQTLLITGASGFTGRHACLHFSALGYRVVAVVRKKVEFTPEVEVISCDLTNKAAVFELIERVQPSYLLHLSGQNHVGISW